MSNGSAIGACTAVLQQLFQEVLVGAALPAALGDNPTVTALAPDRVTVGASEAPQLNLFLYNVKPNLGWTNRELPSHSGAGNRATAAPIGLDLQYVISAYGQGNMHADVLLGQAALVLHATRYLTRERVRALSAASGIPIALRTILAASGLDDQEEMVRLSPETLTIDDISKLWSVFGERYRTSLAFTASVLVLRPDVHVRMPKPVAVANLRVLPVPIAGIERVTPDAAVVGESIVIEGHGLRTDNTVVRFGGQIDLPLPPDATPQRIETTVPAGVQAGLSAVQVIHSVDFGPQSTQREVADSNMMPLVIRPEIAVIGGNPAIAVVGSDIEVTLRPDVERNQRVRMILHGTGALAGQQFVLPVASRALDPAVTIATVAADFAGLPGGSYLISVEVDGVATTLDRNPAGTFVGPQVTLP